MESMKIDAHDSQNPKDYCETQSVSSAAGKVNFENKSMGECCTDKRHTDKVKMVESLEAEVFNW